MSRSWCKEYGDGLRIAVHVQPNASRSEVIGEIGGALKIRLNAPPVDGKANDTLECFIAERLKVPKRDVSVSHGRSGRQKLLQVKTALDVDQAIVMLTG